MEVFERNGFKVIYLNTNMIFASGITKDGLSKSKVDPCGVCRLRVEANFVLCVQCGKLIHG